MDGDQTARFIFLALLGLAIAGGYLVQHRKEMGKVAQQAAVWVLIFVGMIAAVGLWGDIRDDIMPRQSAFAGGITEVPRQRDGHFYLTLDVNGQPIEFLVDTGATQVVMTQRDAEIVGIDLDSLAYLGTAYTANGPVDVAAVRLNTVTLGEIEDRDIRALVNAGDLDQSLLGMSYLDLFERIEITGDALILTR
ncbi:TIGR02281 family clan AA aspartic protease [Octadecabacter sp. R77987]|uniref:retropepsin-like aspartic protease family protein n=1 Tax=Octadecabacter sp. R77987 TaxID=3093874 RepID=UPI00366F9B40